jgi:hypothetical protein
LFPLLVEWQPTQGCEPFSMAPYWFKGNWKSYYCHFSHKDTCLSNVQCWGEDIGGQSDNPIFTNCILGHNTKKSFDRLFPGFMVSESGESTKCSLSDSFVCPEHIQTYFLVTSL